MKKNKKSDLPYIEVIKRRARHTVAPHLASAVMTSNPVPAYLATSALQANAMDFHPNAGSPAEKAGTEILDNAFRIAGSTIGGIAGSALGGTLAGLSMGILGIRDNKIRNALATIGLGGGGLAGTLAGSKIVEDALEDERNELAMVKKSSIYYCAAMQNNMQYNSRNIAEMVKMGMANPYLEKRAWSGLGNWLGQKARSWAEEKTGTGKINRALSGAKPVKKIIKPKPVAPARSSGWGSLFSWGASKPRPVTPKKTLSFTRIPKRKP